MIIQVPSAVWMASLTKYPQATIFHHPSWINMLADCYGYLPDFLAFQNSSGQTSAGLPLMQINSWLTGKRAVALPFSDFCPPLGEINDGFPRELQAWRKQQRLPQLWVHWPLPEGEGVFQEEGFARHITRLNPDPQTVFREFKRTQVQQSIRQAEKAGVVIRRGEEWQDVLLFFGLHLRTHQRLGAPVQPLRFFRLLWERLMAQGLGFVLLAYQGEQLLAGAVFLHWNKTLTYKYSASDPKYWNLRPNNLLLWHAIQWGCEHGYETFDWGKTDLDNQGLCDFKLGWGSQEQILHYTVLADRSPAARLSGGTNQRLMAGVIQHSPAWVCRMIGELLYGHFA
ncbi:MAG: GNAT family N-acetyltransferase [Anaerolineales bacterium]